MLSAVGQPFFVDALIRGALDSGHLARMVPAFALFYVSLCFEAAERGGLFDTSCVKRAGAAVDVSQVTAIHALRAFEVRGLITGQECPLGFWRVCLPEGQADE